MSGFIAMHRDAFTHPLLKDGDRFRAWFWLVANAAWKQTRHDARGTTIIVERGQICAGREYLAKEWGWSASAVERFLKRLETEQMIERTTGQIKTIITICNYDKYQDISDEAEHMSGQKTEQKSDRNRTAKEQGNKETREPNGSHIPPTPLDASNDHSGDATDSAKPDRHAKPRKAKADAVIPHRMPIDWQPGPLPPNIASMVSFWPPGRLEREAEACRDYWLDRTDKRPGWDRTFHNRIRDIHDRVLREARHDRSSNTGRPYAQSGEGDGFTRALRKIRDADRDGFFGDPPRAA